MPTSPMYMETAKNELTFYPRFQIIRWNLKMKHFLFDKLHLYFGCWRGHSLYTLLCMVILISLVVPVWKLSENESEKRLEIRQLLLDNESLRDQLKNEKKCNCEPSTNYELARRKIVKDLNEFWAFVSTKLEEEVVQAKDARKEVFSSARRQYNVLMLDLQNLTETDGYAEWRQHESRDQFFNIFTRVNAFFQV